MTDLAMVVPIEAVALEAKRDRTALAMENAALVRQLRDAGIEPISKTTDEWVALYRRCMELVEAACRLEMEIGGAKELLREFT